MKRLHKSLTVLAVLALWQAATLSGGISPLVLPPPAAVVEHLWKGMTEGPLVLQVVYSLALISKGLAASAVLALGAGYACLALPASRKGFESLATLFHPLPGVALLPLVILWAGAGETAILVIIVHGAFWPLLQNVLSGIRSVPDLYVKVGDNYGLTSREKVTGIILPATAPFLLAGAKIAWARAWRGLISAEMIFGAAGMAGGIGWAIYRSRVFMDPAGILAGLAVIMAIGLLVERFIFRWIERSTVEKWGMME